MRALFSLMIFVLVLHSRGVDAGGWKIDSLQQCDAAAVATTGTVSGIVLDGLCDYPISYANVVVLGTKKGAQTDEFGRYVIQGIQNGYHAITALHMFYGRADVDSVLVRPNENVLLNIRMDRNELVPSGESSCAHVKYADPAIARYSDTSAVFQIQLSYGSSWIWNKRLICILTIENRTLYPLKFPVPMIMPGAGDTNKNNFRIYNSDGTQLQIMGVHVDYIDNGPMIEIDAGAFHSWAFMLDRHFKDFWLSGNYNIEFWYYSEATSLGTWFGRVRMPRLSYSVVKDNE